MRGAIAGGGKRSQMEGSAIAGERERTLVEGSDRRWRGAIAGGRERRGTIAGGGERS